MGIQFNEGVKQGSGSVTIHRVSDNSIVETIAITSSRVNVSNDTVTIDPTSSLTPGTAYYVQIAAGAIEDLAGNDFAGISDPATWNFTTTNTGGTIVQSGGNTAITEGGATDTYTIVLNSQPTADVTIAINSGSQSTTSPTSLTFTSANWNVAQTVTVTAVNDSIAEGNHSSTIQHTATSSDSNYNGLTIGSVTASITDNDTAGVTIVQTGGTTLTEGGATDTYTIVLNTQPTANVTIAIAPDSQSTTNPTSLTFTSANWNVAHG